MSIAASTLWRTFPWEPRAVEGEPFSASFVPGVQGSGRFDLPGSPAGVVYFAELPEHAVAEKIQAFRGRALDADDLLVAGRGVALVSAELGDGARERVVDLCDPAELARFGIRPDQIAALSRATTQRISTQLHAEGYAGLRWWSAFFGEWHTVVLFRERLGTDALGYHLPRFVTMDDPVLAEAAARLDVELG